MKKEVAKSLQAMVAVGGVCILGFLGFSAKKDRRILESVDRLKDDAKKGECLLAIIGKKTQIGASVDTQTGGNISCSC